MKTKAQLIRENEVLFDLAASTDAHRLCDREPSLVFLDQLVSSQEYVKSILKMCEQPSRESLKENDNG